MNANHERAQARAPAEKRVLVIDDDRQIRGILTEVLSLEGYEVQAAENGLLALKVLSWWVPDLIVLDLMMPVMDGRSFRAKQRSAADLSEVPVVVVSAARDGLEQSISLGAHGYIAKPFDLAILLTTVSP